MTPDGSKTKTFSVTSTETRVRCNLHEFNELVGPIRAFDGSATEASRIFPAVLQRQRVCQNRRFYQRQYSEQVQPGSPARFSRSTWCHVFL